jgi:hypothetical protein
MHSLTRLAVPVLALVQALATAPAQGGWSPPVLETALNTSASDTGPSLSYDGLTLHFASFRSSNWELYSATRTAVGQPWSAPALVVGPSDPLYVDDQPFLSVGGQELWFGSTNRPGGTGSIDILVSSLVAPGTWGAPTFVAELNSTGLDSSPTLTADGLEVYFLSTGWGNPSGANNSIFRATRASAGSPFGTPTLVAELSTANTHRDCEISPDGLTIVYTEFVSPRLKVTYAERTNRSAPFGTPVVWTEFDTVGTTTGTFGFTLGPSRNEAVLAANFGTAGSQELMTSRFDGLTHVGIAGLSTSMALNVRDSTRPGAGYMLGAALGNTGFMLGSRFVPLDPDFLLMGTLGVSVPPWSTGFAGVLDGGGEAQGSLTNAGGFLLGLSCYVGAFSIDNAQPFRIGMISNSFRVEFQ